ncbi:MAG: hypothetical protein K9W43_02310 [Candidatus Thorarchaeota archaeon]|nr:hypothetical protein [Candidatus Thorarchaeota archaeon]
MAERNSTKAILERFKNATDEADKSLYSQEFQQAMALYYDASQSADEMFGKFISLLMKTAPSNAYRVLLIEILSWRLRYYTTQYDYHLAVAQTLNGLPREEWLARLETILILSQSLVDKLLPLQNEVADSSIRHRIRKVLVDWVTGIAELVTKLKTWNMSSVEAARVLEWALDNDLRPKM